MNTPNLEARNYLATDADISNLASGMRESQSATDTIPRTYLRAVIAVTIEALGAEQRQRNGKVVKLDEDEQARQLEALEKTLARFYPLVVKRYNDGLPPGPKRAEELNRLTNWARSAALVVRNWIRAGNDLRTVAAAKATKASLAVTPRARAPSPGRIKARVERASKDLIARMLELASVDRATAISEIELAIGQLAAQLEELGVKPTRDAGEAAKEHRPLRVGKSVFFPTQTQIVRMQENPS